MLPTEILFLAGGIAAVLMVIYFAFARNVSDSPVLPAMLGGGFLGFTAVTIWAEGPIGFIVNHSANLWGVQVWYDLIFSLGIAVFLILPRARAVGMRPMPWVLIIGLTASIGLLPMVARLLWLERRAAQTG